MRLQDIPEHEWPEGAYLDDQGTIWVPEELDLQKWFKEREKNKASAMPSIQFMSFDPKAQRQSEYNPSNKTLSKDDVKIDFSLLSEPQSITQAEINTQPSVADNVSNNIDDSRKITPTRPKFTPIRPLTPSGIPGERRAVIPRANVIPSNMPSKAMWYDPSVKIRHYPYFTAEVKKISVEMEHVTIYEIFSQMLEGIETIGMDKRTLTFPDFLYLSIVRKMNSSFMEDNFSLFPICPACQQPNVFSYTYDKFGFFDIELTPEDLPVTEEFTFFYEDDAGEVYAVKKVLEFSPLTIGDILTIYERGREKERLAFIVYQCRNMDPELLLSNEFLNLTIEDDRKLRKVNARMLHGLMPKVESCRMDKRTPDGEFEVNDKGVKMKCGFPITFEVDESYALVIPFSLDTDDSTA